jgi:hypothetical protein
VPDCIPNTAISIGKSKKITVEDDLITRSLRQVELLDPSTEQLRHQVSKRSKARFPNHGYRQFEITGSSVEVLDSSTD